MELLIRVCLFHPWIPGTLKLEVFAKGFCQLGIHDLTTLQFDLDSLVLRIYWPFIDKFSCIILNKILRLYEIKPTCKYIWLCILERRRKDFVFKIVTLFLMSAGMFLYILYYLQQYAPPSRNCKENLQS